MDVRILSVSLPEAFPQVEVAIASAASLVQDACEARATGVGRGVVGAVASSVGCAEAACGDRGSPGVPGSEAGGPATCREARQTPR